MASTVYAAVLATLTLLLDILNLTCPNLTFKAYRCVVGLLY